MANETVHIRNPEMLEKAKEAAERYVQENFAGSDLTEFELAIRANSYRIGVLLGYEDQACENLMDGTESPSGAAKALGVEEEELESILYANGYTYVSLYDFLRALKKRTIVENKAPGVL